MTTPRVIDLVADQRAAAPVPWISAIVASVGSPRVDRADAVLSPQAVGDGAAAEKSAALLSVSAPPVRFSDAVSE